MVSDPHVFTDLAFVFLAAVVGGSLAWALRQPLILGYVFGGLLISPFTPGPSVSDPRSFDLFAEIGVVLLMFSIGLAYLIWYRGVERIGNTRTAIFGNLTPVVAMVAAAVLLHEEPSHWALLGAALTLTGVMVVRSDPGHARPSFSAAAARATAS